MSANLNFTGAFARIRHSGASLATIALRLLSMGAGLAYVKSYTHALPIVEIGEFLYLSSLSYALNALVFVPVDLYLQARIARLEKLPLGAISRLTLVSLGIGLVACLAGGALFVLQHKLQWADIPWLYLVAALLYLCSSLRNLLNIRGHSLFVSGMIVMESIGRLVAFFVISTQLVPTARTLMVSSAAALAAELLVILWQCQRRLTFNDEPRQLDPAARIARTTSVLAAGAVCNTVQLQSYRVLFPLEGLASTSGAFGVVANVGAVAMSSCATIFAQLQLPNLYRTRGISLGSYSLAATMLSLGVLVTTVLGRDLLVVHLTQPQYLPYAMAIGFGVVIEACNLLIGGFGVYLTLRQRAGALLHFQLVAAAVAFAGCLAAIRWAPDSPMLIGFIVAGSQLLVTPSMGFYIWRNRRGNG